MKSCLDCGQEIPKSRTRCIPCAAIHNREVVSRNARRAYLEFRTHVGHAGDYERLKVLAGRGVLNTIFDQRVLTCASALSRGAPLEELLEVHGRVVVEEARNMQRKPDEPTD